MPSRAGIDSIEHGVYLNEEAATTMAERHIPFISNPIGAF